MLLSKTLIPAGSDDAIPDVEEQLLDTYERESVKWEMFGFQRADPVSDIRGGGVLCVQLLIYFLENHPEAAARTLLKQKAETHSRASIENMGVSKCYPWAAAGINVTRMLSQAFQLVGPAGNRNEKLSETKKNFWALTDEFNEVFCILFRLMDKVWLELDADYMQFSRVLSEVKSRMDAALAKAPETAFDLEEALIHSHDGELLLEQGQADIGSNGGKESILSMGTGAEFLMMGWLEKTPVSGKTSTSAGSGGGTDGSKGIHLMTAHHQKWQKRFFVLARLSRVRCVLKYFKTEKESAVIFSRTKERKVLAEAKGRLVLDPTTTVRSIGRDVFYIDSGDFQLQIRTTTKSDADAWIVALSNALASQNDALAREWQWMLANKTSNGGGSALAAGETLATGESSTIGAAVEVLHERAAQFRERAATLSTSAGTPVSPQLVDTSTAATSMLPQSLKPPKPPRPPRPPSESEPEVPKTTNTTSIDALGDGNGDGVDGTSNTTNTAAVSETESAIDI